MQRMRKRVQLKSLVRGMLGSVLGVPGRRRFNRRRRKVDKVDKVGKVGKVGKV